jgi:serine/threonine protein phosphatase 1
MLRSTRDDNVAQPRMLANRRRARHSARMLDRMFRRSGHRRPPPEAPAGKRIYAVGDIHGRSDLLADIHRAIREDARGFAGELVCVYVGDYIDRGPDSRGVIESLAARPLAGCRSHFLMGNHEDIMLRFLADATVAPVWIMNGGGTTLDSYGVEWRDSAADGFAAAQAALRRNLPDPHLRFLRALEPCHEEGGYLFVHAGIRPGRPVERQDPHDLMWIRDEFLYSTADHGHVVVHGHTIAEEPQLLDNRIGIDTGAYATGRLTCLVLEGAERRILQT